MSHVIYNRDDLLSVGGDPIRNQVHLQLLRMLGANQNVNFHIKFKVPKQFQRVREGDFWLLVTESDVVTNSAWQFIYKHFR